MPTLTIHLNNRSYQVACDDGQETRLSHLARQIDEKIQAMRQQFGTVNDEKYLVFASLMVADELQEAKERVAELELQVETLQRQQPAEQLKQERSLAFQQCHQSLLPLIEQLEAIAQSAEDA